MRITDVEVIEFRTSTNQRPTRWGYGVWLDEPVGKPARTYAVEGFVRRVRDRMTPRVLDDDVVPGIQAVMIALRDAVGEAELTIALEPLPDEYDELLVRA